jgi:hypothetical protein
MQLTLKRDKNHSIISTSDWGFFHRKSDFVVSSMVCPHIALEDLLITLDTEYLIQKFECLHRGARIRTRVERFSFTHNLKDHMAMTSKLSGISVDRRYLEKISGGGTLSTASKAIEYL